MSETPLFNHQAVRDLAWVCLSPGLLSALPNNNAPSLLSLGDLDEHTALLSWLTELDQNPKTLHQHLNELRSPRLGIYYEALNAFFWQQYPGNQLLAQNLQVQESNKTLGEFDLITNRAGKNLHIELAVKYYLGVPDNRCKQASQWQQWLGPNCNDRLDIKMQRLLSHQLRLSQTKAGKACLNKHITGELSCNLQLQGYLFYPAHSTMPTPQHIGNDHLRGKWYYLDHFLTELENLNNSLWLNTPKSRWLSKVVEHTDSPDILSNTLLAQQLRAYFASSAKPAIRPLLLTRLYAQSSRCIEQERCFVVANNWPWNN